MPEFVIEELTSSDLPQVRGVIDVFGEAFEDTATYGGAAPDDAYLARLLAQPHVCILAASIGGTVIGGLAAYELGKIEQARSEFYIYDLGVAASHRRKGVATALIERVGAIAKARGAHVVYVQADYVDAPAVALYTKLGRREEVLHFDISVDR